MTVGDYEDGYLVSVYQNSPGIMVVCEKRKTIPEAIALGIELLIEEDENYERNNRKM